MFSIRSSSNVPNSNSTSCVAGRDCIPSALLSSVLETRMPSELDRNFVCELLDEVLRKPVVVFSAACAAERPRRDLSVTLGVPFVVPTPDSFAGVFPLLFPGPSL